MKAVLTSFRTSLDPKSRHTMDEGNNEVYNSFEDLYRAEKDGALRGHAKEANADAYLEIVTADDNRTGLYIGVSSAGEQSEEEARQEIATAVVDLLLEHLVFQER